MTKKIFLLPLLLLVTSCGGKLPDMATSQDVALKNCMELGNLHLEEVMSDPVGWSSYHPEERPGKIYSTSIDRREHRVLCYRDRWREDYACYDADLEWITESVNYENGVEWSRVRRVDRSYVGTVLYDGDEFVSYDKPLCYLRDND